MRSQPQLVFIYRPRMDGRLSTSWCEVTQADIGTCNLPIANLALCHTGTSAPMEGKGTSTGCRSVRMRSSDPEKADEEQISAF